MDAMVHGTDMAEASSVCVPPDSLLPGILVRAPKGDQFLNEGLSTEVVVTFLNSRSPSTRNLSWCRQYQLDSGNCPVASALEFLQDHFFSASLSPSIAVFHVPLASEALGYHHTVVHFFHGMWRMRHMAQVRVPAWDLSIAFGRVISCTLRTFGHCIFKCVPLKTVLLLAITSLERCDLQALSVASSCLQFAPGRVFTLGRVMCSKSMFREFLK